jgi:hypothetical protein
VRNLAPDSVQSDRVAALRARMESALKAQGDPRMLGNGQVFDQYKPTAGGGFYEQFMRGEKPRAGWVNETDFEREKIASP